MSVPRRVNLTSFIRFIKHDEFIKISEFVIPRPELCDKLISLKLGNSYLIGYPIHLENTKYDRTKFQFNFSLIITVKEFENNFTNYEILLNKIAKIYECLEVNRILLNY